MKKSRNKKTTIDTPLSRAVARDDITAAISILKDKSLFVPIPGKHIEIVHSATLPELPANTASPVPEQIVERPASPHAQRRMSHVSALSNASGSPEGKAAIKSQKKISKLKSASQDPVSPSKLKSASNDANQPHDTSTPTIDLTANAAAHKVKIIKIALESVPVYNEPSMYGVVVCHLKHDVIVTTDSHLSHKPTFWIKIPCGYIQSHDSQHTKAYHLTNALEANQFWILEGNRRQRMASAVCSMLIKSYTLPNALRFARSLLKHAHTHYPNVNRELDQAGAIATSAINMANSLATRPRSPGGLFEDPTKTPAALALVGTVTAAANSPDHHGNGHHRHHRHKDQVIPQLVTYSNLAIEDIMIALNGKIGLKKEQVFEYIKIAASSQSNPILCILLITEDIYNLLNVRPTLWTTNHLNILETEDVRLANDRFVMAAANGDIQLFQHCLDDGQELTNIHSELRYTALHAAADFGQADVIKLILSKGLSINIRDPKKGYTALHFAAASGRNEIAQLLLEHGANRKIGCGEGLKPYELAHKWGHIECREITKYIVPVVRFMSATECTINSITVRWESPPLNAMFHSPIIEYMIDCLPANYYPEEEMHEHEHETILNHHVVPMDYPRPLSTFAPQQNVKFSGLISSTAYRFIVKCRSLSGWCNYSQPVVFYTQAWMPEKPAPMEVIKVTTNGLLLTWQPPIRDNGHPVQFYQIEILEEKMYLEKKKSRPNTASKSRSRPNTAGKKQITFDEAAEKPVDESMDLTQSQEEGALVDGTTGMSGDAKADGLEDNPTGENKLSKSHRVVKHLSVDHRFRYLTGLEPFRPYVMRTRAFNKIGPSPWSNWTVAVAPKPGITVGGFNGQRLSAQVNWFTPVLSDGRTLEYYELQMCNLKGPTQKTFTLMASKAKPPSPVKTSDSVTTHMAELLNAKPNKNTCAEESNEFVTIANDILTNSYEVKNLKAGGRYQCRVRCKVKQEPDFFDWDTAILSEIFAMSATVPDPPYNVRPVLLAPTAENEKYMDLNELSTVGGSLLLGDSQSLDPMENNSGDVQNSSQAINSSLNPTEYPEDYRRDKFAIMHDSITIEWNNGNSNGAVINKYRIEMAKVRPYRYGDVLTAETAHFQSAMEDVMLLNKKGELEEIQNNALLHKEHVESVLQQQQQQMQEMQLAAAEPSVDIDKSGLPNDGGADDFSAIDDSFEQPESLEQERELNHYLQTDDASIANIDELVAEPPALEWVDVTAQGVFCGALKFRVHGLTPGGAYIFRMQQHNACGWSPHSTSSDIISTYTSTPPGRPALLKVAGTFCILNWMSDDKVENFINLTTLEHQVQMGILVDKGSAIRSDNFMMLTQQHGPGSPSKTTEEVQWFTVETATSMADKHISLEMYSRDDYSSVHSLLGTNEPHTTTVMVQKLMGGTNYVARVRVRTVMGWSPWSEVSEPFRTHG